MSFMTTIIMHHSTLRKYAKQLSTHSSIMSDSAGSANFGRSALILAICTVARVLLHASPDRTLLDQMKTCLQDYAVLVSSLAAAITTASALPSNHPRQADAQSLSEQGFSPSKILDWMSGISSRSDGGARSQDLRSLGSKSFGLHAGSLLTQYMPGPTSQASARTDSMGTDISLSSGDAQMEPEKSRELFSILETLRMGKAAPGSDTDQSMFPEPAMSEY